MDSHTCGSGTPTIFIDALAAYDGRQCGRKDGLSAMRDGITPWDPMPPEVHDLCQRT